MNNTIIIGSRGSELALWQAYHVQARLQKKYKGLDVQIKIIKTKGDKIQNQALSVIGDKGLFTKEIEQALIDNKIDLAVHSLKDLQTQVPEGLRIAAITKREKVNDVLISRQWKSLSDLPEGATIATGSLRRQSQLKHLRPDLNIIDIRGNLNTRFKKFDKSKWDGMILAFAGVERLGWRERIAEIIPTHHVLPAVGQGALGIEIREDDTETMKRLAFLNHEATVAAATAERTLMRELEGGCQVPIGAYARVEKGILVLDAMVGNLDGTLRLDARSTSSRLSGANALGRRVARKLINNGAVEILDEIRLLSDKA
jgi:hydroxymethylbilane synthase